MQNNNKKVVIGGTFDLLHRGHKEIIKKGFEYGDVVIGLTSNEMAKEMKNRKIEDFEDRKKALENHSQENLNKEIEVRKIEDKFGFAVNDENLHYIVVSPETEENSFLINKERENFGKDSLEIIKIDFILAKDGKPISSTRIHNNEIDQEGELI